MRKLKVKAIIQFGFNAQQYADSGGLRLHSYRRHINNSRTLWMSPFFINDSQTKIDFAQHFFKRSTSVARE